MFDLSEYEEVKDRIPRYYAQYPDGRIVTEMIYPNPDAWPPEMAMDISLVIFRARLYKTAEEQERGLVLSVGHAFERESARGVNSTSHLENAETSAIGRALANIGIQGKLRPSREEMAKVRSHETPEVAAAPRPTRPEARTNGNQLEAKRKAFFANVDKLGVDKNYAHDFVKRMFDLDSFNDANVEQLREAYKALMKESGIAL